MKDVYYAKTQKEQIEILDKIKGIGLPIASAILTVCYPEKFTILDYRVWNILLKDKKVGNKNPPNTIFGYLNYVNICKKYSRKLKLSLRDFDRAMWGRSFYESLKEFFKTKK
jgi:thermostable 8-oxoguanine DNA glycosylase